MLVVRQSLREGGIPFKISEGRPSPTTVQAMLEAERIARDPNVPKFDSVEELLADLDS